MYTVYLYCVCTYVPCLSYSLLNQPRFLGALVILGDDLTHLEVTKHVHDHICINVHTYIYMHMSTVFL